MPARKFASFQAYFADVTDQRRRQGTYPLINSIVLAVCAVIYGADDSVAIAEFSRAKRKFLEKFLDLTAGTPPHDRFNAIFHATKPAEFEKCLLRWITALHGITNGQVVAIDGKILRCSFDAASSKAAIPRVIAWATANHISLGQIVVDEKSNEIAAIPKLLDPDWQMTFGAIALRMKLGPLFFSVDGSFQLTPQWRSDAESGWCRPGRPSRTSAPDDDLREG